MPSRYKHMIVASIIMLLGIWFSRRYKEHASDAVGFWYKLFKVRYDEKYLRLLFLFGGIVFVVVGLLGILGILKLK